MEYNHRSFRVLRRVERGKRLIVFPHAGAGASSVESWLTMLPEDVELCVMQRAGREERFAETAHSSLLDYLSESCNILTHEIDSRPYFFWGHSLGGFLAYQTAVWLKNKNLQMPKALFISSISPTPLIENYDSLCNAQIELIRSKLMDDNNIDLNIREEFFKKATTTYQNDLKLYFNSIKYSQWSVLDIDFMTFYGEYDETVSRDNLLAWKNHTGNVFNIHEIKESGHMFVDTPKINEVLGLIYNEMKRY